MQTIYASLEIKLGKEKDSKLCSWISQSRSIYVKYISYYFKKFKKEISCSGCFHQVQRPLVDFLPLPTRGDSFVSIPWNEGLLGVTWKSPSGQGIFCHPPSNLRPSAGLQKYALPFMLLPFRRLFLSLQGDLTNPHNSPYFPPHSHMSTEEE